MSYNGGILTRLDEVWSPELFGADGLPVLRVQSLAEQRGRSRNLEQNNVLASGVLDRACENVIGTGIRIRPATSSPTFNEKLKPLWSRLVEGKRFDVRRMFAFDQVQRMLYRATHRDGDIGLLLIDRGAGPEIQVLEGDDVETPTGNRGIGISDGVEVGPAGAPVAYWVRELKAAGSRGISHRRIPARDVIWLTRTHRYKTVRGVPSFHAQYGLFDQIIGLLDAVVVAMRVGASQALIVKKKRPGNTGLRTLTVNSMGEDVSAKPIEPGMINFVYTDEDVQGFTPTQPGQSFPEAMRVFARFVGLKFGLTLERVLLDFSQANYSVSRSTALQEQRTAEMEQWDFDKNLFARLWPWLVGKWVKNGDVVGPVPDDAWKYEWIPNGRPLVEPSKDAPGLKMLVEMGVESPQNIATSAGYDPQQLCKDNADWVEMRGSVNLPPFGFAAAAPAIPPEQE